jgi:outer membrane protein TolC
MKKISILIYLLCIVIISSAQSLEKLTIDEAYSLARENYPLIKQRELISKSEEYSVSNAAKGILPVITINGQDSYQSAVTSIPIPQPEMNVEPLSKHQYKVYGELSAHIYDGGVIKNQKAKHHATAKIEHQELEVQLYQLKDRINQLYFGILLLDAQLNQNQLLKDDIQRGIDRIEASIANGVALKSSGDVLQAELLKVEQRTIELNASSEAFVDMLELMIGKAIDSNTQFEMPASLAIDDNITRPELKLYDFKSDAIDVQMKTLATRNRPRLSLFFQGGYGRPALDMLNNTAEGYYITGVRLNWTISGLYTYKKEKALLTLNQSNLNLQKETFLFNTKLSMKSQSGEVSKLQDVLASDDEIIILRKKIKETASTQLENGVINSNDYLREVTAEDQARQNKILHEIQLRLAQYNLQTTAGI